jgi:hypothetical protein
MRLESSVPAILTIEEDDRVTAIVFEEGSLEAHFQPENTFDRRILEKLAEKGKWYFSWSPIDDLSMRSRMFVFGKRWLFHCILGFGYFRLSFPSRRKFAEIWITEKNPEAVVWADDFIRLGDPSWVGVQEEYARWHRGRPRYLHRLLRILKNMLKRDHMHAYFGQKSARDDSMNAGVM